MKLTASFSSWKRQFSASVALSFIGMFVLLVCWTINALDKPAPSASLTLKQLIKSKEGWAASFTYQTQSPIKEERHFSLEPNEAINGIALIAISPLGEGSVDLSLKSNNKTIRLNLAQSVSVDTLSSEWIQLTPKEAPSQSRIETSEPAPTNSAHNKSDLATTVTQLEQQRDQIIQKVLSSTHPDQIKSWTLFKEDESESSQALSALHAQELTLISNMPDDHSLKDVLLRLERLEGEIAELRKDKNYLQSEWREQGDSTGEIAQSGQRIKEQLAHLLSEASLLNEKRKALISNFASNELKDLDSKWQKEKLKQRESQKKQDELSKTVWAQWRDSHPELMTELNQVSTQTKKINQQAERNLALTTTEVSLQENEQRKEELSHLLDRPGTSCGTRTCSRGFVSNRGACDWFNSPNGLSCGAMAGPICFSGKCLRCEQRTIASDLPACPSHPAFVCKKAERVSCTEPDRCRYRLNAPDGTFCGPGMRCLAGSCKSK